MVKVEIYTSPFCGYCGRAKNLLREKGVDFTEYDVMADAARREEMVSRAGGRQTVPQIFINGEHIGGSDDLASLAQKDLLDEKLASKSA